MQIMHMDSHSNLKQNYTAMCIAIHSQFYIYNMEWVF